MALSLAGSLAAMSLFGATPKAWSAQCSPSRDTTDLFGFRTIVFTAISTCTWDLGAETSVEILVVGGGGGGATSDANTLGGGGGGGVATGSTALSGTLTITVGDGGASVNTGRTGNDGQASSIISTAASITAFGGGRGAGFGDPGDGYPGGSGGGGHPWNGDHSGGTATQGKVTLGLIGIVLHGNDGASAIAPTAGGGGGGVGSAASPVLSGNVGGAGGAGLSSSITGTAVVYGSGGGGSGVGGGGIGGTNAGNGSGNTNSFPASAGVDGTGGGGGGGGFTAGGSGKGGSGVVVLKFRVGPGDPSAVITTYLDKASETGPRTALLGLTAKMSAGQCQGIVTSYNSLVRALVTRGNLSNSEAQDLLTAVGGLCVP